VVVASSVTMLLTYCCSQYPLHVAFPSLHINDYTQLTLKNDDCSWNARLRDAEGVEGGMNLLRLIVHAVFK